MEGMKKEFKDEGILLLSKILKGLFKYIWVVISWTIYVDNSKRRKGNEGKEIIELDWGSEWYWTSHFVDGHDLGMLLLTSNWIEARGIDKHLPMGQDSHPALCPQKVYELQEVISASIGSCLLNISLMCSGGFIFLFNFLRGRCIILLKQYI